MSGGHKQQEAMDYQVLLLVSPVENEDILGIRKEISENGLMRCDVEPTLEGVFEVMEKTLPDLVMLFADELEAAGEDVMAFCREFRTRPFKYRPVLVIQSTAAEEQRIGYLMEGADDFLPGGQSLDELQVRLLVHLRRNLDLMTDDVTRIAGLPFVSRVFQRRTNRGDDWALVMVELSHYHYYLDAYGQLAGNQVLRTFSSMLQQYVMVPDCIGHAEDNRFLVLTHPDKAEKIAAVLCRQFENVSPNFYSPQDRKQGYMVSVTSRKAGRRVPLLSLSVGIVASTTMKAENFMAAYHAANEMKDLARMTSGSHWQSLHPKLAGERATVAREEGRRILVVESDAALAFLLKTTLEMQGYEVEAVSGCEDATAFISESECEEAAHPFHLVILDSMLHGEPVGLALSQDIRARYADKPILCITSSHSREEVLAAGADLYLPKPFDLVSLFSWIERLLERR